MEIFILEDDPSWQFIYRESLSDKFDLRVFSSLEEFEASVTPETKPFLLLADLRLNERSFVSYLREHPELAKKAKIIVLSALDDVDTLEECFSLGVSDYLTKPINIQELLVKTKRLFDAATHKNSYGLDVDWRSNRASYNNKEVQLTTREFQILTQLIERGEAGTPKEYLLNTLWKNTNVTSNTVEVHICNMRKKLESLGFDIISKPPNTFYLRPFIATPQTEAPLNKIS